MLKRLLLVLAVIMGAFALAPAPASAASLGDPAGVAAAGNLVERAQYYGPRRGYYRGYRGRGRAYGRRFVRPRVVIVRPRPYYGRRYVGPRGYYRGPRRFYGY